MASKRPLRGSAVWPALLAALAVVSGARAQNCDCEKGCCPPYLKYRYEGAPKIKYKRGCPKPICDPCQLEHYGYFGTCWHPWPFPPDWSHCPVPPPAALIQPVPNKRFRMEGTDVDPMKGKDKDKEKDKDRETGPKPMKDRTSNDPLVLPSAPPVKPDPAYPVSITTPTPPPPIPTPPPPPPTPTSLTPVQPVVVPPAPLPTMKAETMTPYNGVAAHRPTPMTHADPVEPQEPTSTVKPAVTEKQDSSAVVPSSYKLEKETIPNAVSRPRTGTGGPSMRLVSSRRILLDYDLRDVPVPQMSMLELWYTQDGRHWNKDQTSVRSGAPYVIEVNKEGTYGFMMVARDPQAKSVPPTPGETPQVWVEVDWTKPVVSMSDVKAGLGTTGRIVSIAWKAEDNNLSPKPIVLSYAERADGPWTTIASGIENNGRYVWQVPSNVPTNVIVRIEALDLVGNSGSSSAAVQLP